MLAHPFSRTSSSASAHNHSAISLSRNVDPETGEDTTELPPASLRSAFAARRPSLLKDERGLSTVEYVILLAMIAVGSIAAWDRFSGALLTKLSEQESAVRTLAPSQDGESGTAPSGGSEPPASNGSSDSSGSSAADTAGAVVGTVQQVGNALGL